jgi:6-phosphofructokinase 1
MSLSGMAVTFKASTSSTTQQQWLHPTKVQGHYGFAHLIQRKCRKRSALLHVRDTSDKLDLDFTDPSWKQKYQEDWDRRFNLPHITDIYDLKPRPTTFSLKKNRFVLVCHTLLISLSDLTGLNTKQIKLQLPHLIILKCTC